MARLIVIFAVAGPLQRRFERAKLFGEHDDRINVHARVFPRSNLFA
jgi:hypothetical protein